MFSLRSHPPEITKFEDRLKDPRGWLWGDLLIRELIRQSVLLAARDELGLATRDEAFREPIGAHPDVAVVDIVTRATHGRSVWLKLTFDDEEIWEHEVPCMVGPVDQYVDITEKLERLSRQELAKILSQIGLQGQPPKASDGAVREEILQKLTEVNLLSQYHALRLCHDQIRNDGASPERLGVLVRAYANLGQLTQPFLSSMHRSFRARSLLYAQRLISTAPESPWGWWHRAYALSLAGLQRWSIEDLKRADELFSDEHAPPSWVSLLSSYNRYEFATLMHLTEGENDLSQLAGLLLFASVETSKTAPLIVETGMFVSQLNPLDVRVWDGMHREAGVGYSHLLTEAAPERFAASLAKKISELDSVAGSVQTVLDRADTGTLDGRSRLGLALAQQAGAADDRNEPSLAILGRLIEEQNVLQIYRRAIFMRDSWSVDSEEFLAAHREAYQAHPYADLISSLAIPGRAPATRFQEVLENQEIGDTNLASMTWLLSRVPKQVRFANMSREDAWGQMYYQRAALEFEYFLNILTLIKASDRVQYAKWMYDVSPHSPYRYYVLIKEDWEGSQASLQEWEQEYGQHPLVALAFAEHHESQRDWEKAEEYYRTHIDLMPTIEGIISLAKVQHKQSGEDWIATLESALKLEDYGLSHAEVNCRIAATLMEKRDYSKALPYAKAAATSYAGWALACLAFCYEGLGEFGKAEAVMRAVTERYESGQWYHWCIRTGRGDLEAAWNGWQELLRSQGGKDSVELRMAEIQHLIFLGKKEEAYDLAKKHGVAFGHPVNALARAMLCEELGHHEEARALVDATVHWGAFIEQQASYDGISFKPIAEFLAKVMATPEIDEATIQQLLARHELEEGGTVMSYLGWHLANRDQQNLAKKYLSGLVASPRWDSYDVLYALVKLRDLGVRVQDIPRRYDYALDSRE